MSLKSATSIAFFSLTVGTVASLFLWATYTFRIELLMQQRTLLDAVSLASHLLQSIPVIWFFYVLRSKQQ